MDRKRSLQTPSATTAIYDLMEGSHNKVGGERSHDFAVIGLNHTLEGGTSQRSTRDSSFSTLTGGPLSAETLGSSWTSARSATTC